MLRTASLRTLTLRQVAASATRPLASSSLCDHPRFESSWSWSWSSWSWSQQSALWSSVRQVGSLPSIHVVYPTGLHHRHSPSFVSSAAQRRQFSSHSSKDGKWTPTSGDESTSISTMDSTTTTFGDTATIPSVEETLDSLFQESQQQIADAVSTVPSDAWYAAADTAATTAADWVPTWYNVADQAIVVVKAFHDLSGMEYGWSIVGVTIVMRLALFPLMVQTQRTTSRMAHLQPELQMIKSRYEAIGTPSRQDQLQFSKQMKALFEKYQVKPFRGFLAPLVQLPLFMGMFFGLQKMPNIYHDELATGGMFWFPDLTIPDPLYILPIASAGTFLLLIELGKEQMMAQNAASGQMMINVMRIMSVAMLPVCVGFHSSMLCYWTANNLLTLAQTAVLKEPHVRKYLGIWDPPKPVPGMQPETLTEAMNKLVKRLQGQHLNEQQKIEKHNKTVDAKKKAQAFGMMRRTREQRGITGKKAV